jgi:hypothetical protein
VWLECTRKYVSHNKLKAEVHTGAIMLTGPRGGGGEEEEEDKEEEQKVVHM